MRLSFTPSPVEVEILTPLGQDGLLMQWLIYPEEEGPELLSVWSEKVQNYVAPAAKFKDRMESAISSPGYDSFRATLEVYSSTAWADAREEAYASYGDYIYDRDQDEKLLRGIEHE